MIPFIPDTATDTYTLLLAIATFLFFLVTLLSIYYTQKMSKIAIDALKVNKLLLINDELSKLEQNTKNSNALHSSYYAVLSTHFVTMKKIIEDFESGKSEFNEKSFAVIPYFVYGDIREIYDNHNQNGNVSLKLQVYFQQIFMESFWTANEENLTRMSKIINGIYSTLNEEMDQIKNTIIENERNIETLKKEKNNILFSRTFIKQKK